MTHEKRPINRIACVGEAMIELVLKDDWNATLGVAGDTYNTSVYLARALRGTGISVSFVTAVGMDPYSDKILSETEGHGISTDFIERRSGMMPGLYAINTDAQGERSFSYWRSNSAARSLFGDPCEIGLDTLFNFDLVFLTGITLAILPQPVRARIAEWAKEFRAGGGTLAYDSNHRPQLWETAEAARKTNQTMWGLTDIALPSVDDEAVLLGDIGEDSICQRLRGFGVTNGVMKRGAKGPLDLATGQGLERLAQARNVIDTTAAGDSFNAGYLSAIVQGKSPVQAMAAGHMLALDVVSQSGAIIPER